MADPVPAPRGTVEQPTYGAEQTILVPLRGKVRTYALKRQVFTDTGFTTMWVDELKDWINWSGSWKDVETLGTFASPDEARDFMIARATSEIPGGPAGGSVHHGSGSNDSTVRSAELSPQCACAPTSLSYHDKRIAKAPEMLALIVCPVCGPTDRYVSLKTTGKHYTAGKLCPGTPEVVRYRKEDR